MRICLMREMHMHNEKAYIETKPGKIIPFSLAKEIREF